MNEAVSMRRRIGAQIGTELLDGLQFRGLLTLAESEAAFAELGRRLDEQERKGPELDWGAWWVSLVGFKKLPSWLLPIPEDADLVAIMREKAKTMGPAHEKDLREFLTVLGYEDEAGEVL